MIEEKEFKIAENKKEAFLQNTLKNTEDSIMQLEFELKVRNMILNMLKEELKKWQKK